MSRTDRRRAGQRGPAAERGAFRKADPGEHSDTAPPVVAAMRAEPGEWFVVEEGAPRWALKHGQNYGWLTKHPDGFEIDIRDGLPGDAPLTATIAGAMGIVTVYARALPAGPDLTKEAPGG